MRPKPGTELVLEIDSLAHGGRGVARANGYVVFVSGALPGDSVRARLSKAKRDYGEASATEILAPSPRRLTQAPAIGFGPLFFRAADSRGC